MASTRSPSKIILSRKKKQKNKNLANIRYGRFNVKTLLLNQTFWDKRLSHSHLLFLPIFIPPVNGCSAGSVAVKVTISLKQINMQMTAAPAGKQRLVKTFDSRASIILRNKLNNSLALCEGDALPAVKPETVASESVPNWSFMAS